MIINFEPVDLSTPAKPGHLKMKFISVSSNLTEASVELFFETHSRERRQVVTSLVVAGLTSVATTAVESWFHKSRMVSFCFAQLFSNKFRIIIISCDFRILWNQLYKKQV